MVEYRSDGTEVHTVRRRRGGGTILPLLIIAALVIALLFATGFWSANVTKSGVLPEVSVKGGALPRVDLQSKQVVVGTNKTTVQVPTVKTETKTVEVPTIGVTSEKK